MSVQKNISFISPVGSFKTSDYYNMFGQLVVVEHNSPAQTLCFHRVNKQGRWINIGEWDYVNQTWYGTLNASWKAAIAEAFPNYFNQ